MNDTVNIPALLAAIDKDIDNPSHWLELSRLATKGMNMPVGEISRLVIRALHENSLKPSVLSQFVFGLLGYKHSIRLLLEAQKKGNLEAFIVADAASALFEDELLLAILPNVILHAEVYEKLFTGIRRALLSAILKRKLAPGTLDTAVEFISALSSYCFAVEYVFYTAPEEIRELKKAKLELIKTDKRDIYRPLLAAIIGCYELLDGLETNDPAFFRLDEPESYPLYSRMLYLQLDQRQAERRAYAEVKTFNTIEDDVSLSVQKQYSENPYPRWISLHSQQPATLDAHIRETLPFLPGEQRPPAEKKSKKQPLSVLIAGCGTGREALLAATKFHDVNVTAVDLSRASLAYAQMKAEELGVENVNFLQGDLLDLPLLDKRFDLIESCGVLHHMEKPMAGLAALEQCLKPGGWMKIALYSFLGREKIRLGRKIIEAMDLPGTPAEIREFRQRIMQDPGDELFQICTNWRDFYSLSECRDLLFHVQEHQFTIEGLRDLISPFDLTFMGFELDNSQLPASGAKFPDPQSLDHWSAFEQSHPMTFAGMYIIWLRKPERAAGYRVA